MQRRIVNVEGITPVVRGYPSAVVASGIAFFSGVRSGGGAAVRDFRNLPDHFVLTGTGYALADGREGEVAADSWMVYDNFERVLKAVGMDGSQVLRQHFWQRDKRFFPVCERIRMLWQKDPPPSSGLGVADVVGRFSRWIGMDAIGVVPGVNPLFPQRSMVRTFDNKTLPSASYYSQAVRCGPLVFFAGHIAIETDKPGKPVIRGFDDIPEQGRFLATGRSHPDSRDGPIAAQSWYCYDRIRENLNAQGLDLRNVVHVSVYLQDLRDFTTFHRIHRHFFPDNGPALVVTGFNEVGHRGTLIEIEPTATQLLPGFEIDSVAWPIAAPFAGPAAVRTGPLWFFAGMPGLNAHGIPARGAHEIDDDVGRHVVTDLCRFESQQGFAAQCWQAWKLLGRVCEAAGLSLAKLTKTTVYLRSAADIWIFEEIRETIFGHAPRHAVEFVAIHGPGPVPDAHVQIEAIASDD